MSALTVRLGFPRAGAHAEERLDTLLTVLFFLAANVEFGKSKITVSVCTVIPC